MHNLLVNILRIAIALQTAGTAIRYLGLFGSWEDESPVFGLLLYDWQWSQDVAQQVDDWGNGVYLLCGLALVVIPIGGALLQRATGRDDSLVPIVLWQVPLCIVIALWQVTLTAVAWSRGGSFMTEWFVSLGLFQLSLPWTFVSSAVRYAMPIALVLLTPFGKQGISQSRVTSAIWLLRIAASLTFIGHGIKAIFCDPMFLDYLLVAAEQIRWEVSESTAKTVLRTIGVMDLALAISLMTMRLRAVALYMAAWALIAAFSRVVHSGWPAYYEVLLRAGNFCVPLAVGIYWQLTRTNTLPSSTASQEPTDAPTPAL